MQDTEEGAQVQEGASPEGRDEEQVARPQDGDLPPHILQQRPGMQVGRVQIRHRVAVVRVMHREGVHSGERM